MGHVFVESLTELVDVTADLVERYRLEPQSNEYSSRRSGDEPAVVKYRQVRGAWRSKESRIEGGRGRGETQLLHSFSIADFPLSPASSVSIAELLILCPPALSLQLMQALAYLETLQDRQLRVATQRLSRVLADAWKARGGGLEDHLRAMPSFYTFVMSLFQRLGAVVNSGVLKDAFNLEIMLFPWNESGQAVPGQKPVVILLEGRGHYFTNRPTQLTGDARFRYDMVRALAKDRFAEVLRITVWDWKISKGREGKVALIRGLLAEKGLDLADYLPPRSADGPREGEEEEDVDWDLGSGELGEAEGGFGELERDWEEEQDERKRMQEVMEGMARRRGLGDGEGEGGVDEPSTLKPRKRAKGRPAKAEQEKPPKPPSRPSVADRPL